ncbi:hypothetical protein GC194_04465 [bacterium]|nr:hypothetical protein [bacterium]
MKKYLFSFTWPFIAVLFIGISSSGPSGKLMNGPHIDTCNVVDMTMDTGFDCCGGDEEDPIGFISLVDQNLDPIGGAAVEVFDNLTSISVGGTFADSNGDFAIQVNPGWYYFGVTPVGGSVQYTSAYHFYQSDTTFTIQLVL